MHDNHVITMKAVSPTYASESTLISKLIERALAFDAVELFGFPSDALFDHFEAVGRSLEQVPLRAGLQIAGRG